MDLDNYPPPDLSWSNIKHYLGTRISTLKPPKLTEAEKKHMNPIPALRLLNKKQWLFVGVALAGWTWDAFDFFSVGVVATQIAEDLNVTVKDVTWGITLVLMLRAVGAVLFGVASDRYGRKWPFIFNNFLFVVLELGTGFVQTYQQFLGVRALFGIAMGGLYGNAAATALEDCPPEARGFISGLFQKGYGVGYLLCVVFARAIADTSPYGWRALFWFGACPPVLIMIFRFFLPETDTYIQSKKNAEAEGVEKQFWQGVKTTFKSYWLMFFYLVLFMTGFNFLSHGSQDLYPTMLRAQLGFDKDQFTITNSVASLGSIFGGMVIGHASFILGRRLTILLACILGAACIYPWAFVTGPGINAGVFFLQFFAQGAWGVVPIHLTELSPPALRSSMIGIAYQLGNLASSGSSTIQATIGTQFPLRDENGKIRPGVYNYSLVMAIFIACVFVFLFVVTLLGPERRHAEMIAGGAGHRSESDEKIYDEEKGAAVNVEQVESPASTPERSASPLPTTEVNHTSETLPGSQK
ncbi:YALI0C21406p [Yarrowia lipolytica CLIB122]|uniref:YALI0C21406p n=2 Tax=Yarrowia lipolytica TaxID=4952 RepID=Q6CB72_YARLI|nr:YALI0C21406p [Yarrowia lipolytica CLIB122]AOW03198.1 hypothetical protein YALI1_C29538g [Yarrowia lipolytica]KAB8281152.1 major facilitator superfamily domain-containing protein [Yarrowia lipolytica]KAE8172991.1 major facilitator superfamily domain-containing protein [Yarrowia lipolytica]KAJ8053700.1 major facilitator superfamily domain-containing protein [Yarrowia lipolytica]RMI96140.1 major facilitator superfamily domain-containing protein [Yarrowia lipolytica]|eukprot:XP_502090.1 YALI0C21406p [Yarrowia lipolytica CLIB122]